MANLISSILDKVVSLTPTVQRLRGELAAQQQLYDKNNIAQGLVAGKYYQQVDPGNGNIKGFSAVCHCGQEWRMLSMFECFRQGYACPNCKMEISVLKHVSAIDAEGNFKVKAHELEALLTRLPVRPVGISQSGPRFVDTWDGVSTDKDWDGEHVGGRSKAFEMGDPGMMGPGF